MVSQQTETFEILAVQSRVYSRFHTRGTQWKVRLNPPLFSEISPAPDPVTHFVDSVNDLFDHVLEDVGDADLVGITVHNEVNQTDTSIGFAFRQKDQLSSDVIWNVFDKVTQSNSRFDASDTLIVTVHSVTMPVGFGGIKQKGRPVASMVHLKRSIAEVRAEENCLAHALIIAISSLNNDPNIKAYRQGRKMSCSRPITCYNRYRSEERGWTT